MFTTQVGPTGLPDEYLKYLRDDCLQKNLDNYEELKAPYMKKSNGRDVSKFFSDDFDAAFKLTVPKSLTELALEQDWHVDGEQGIQVFQFDRAFKDGSYRMLHMAMLFRRQQPPRENRAPGQATPAAALSEHKKGLQLLFDHEVTAVETLVIDGEVDKLSADLQALFKHREKYYRPPDPLNAPPVAG